MSNTYTDEQIESDSQWLHKFIQCVPFGADVPGGDINRAHSIVTAKDAEIAELKAKLAAMPFELIPVEEVRVGDWVFCLGRDNHGDAYDAFWQWADCASVPKPDIKFALRIKSEGVNE